MPGKKTKEDIPSESPWNCLPDDRTGKGYRTALYLMLALVFLLCASNLFIYDSYKDIRTKFSRVTSENEAISEEYQLIKQENEAISGKFSEIVGRCIELERKNEELSKEVKELTEDNIALQNSLKAAASAGIKPMNYTRPKELSSRGSIDRGDYIGKFLGTAYTPSNEECGNNRGITRSGKPIIPGVSIAVDCEYWPLGTVFYIKGLGYAVAMDTGSAIKGKYRFDFSVLDQNFAKALGSQEWDVYLVKPGNGRVEVVDY